MKEEEFLKKRDDLDERFRKNERERYSLQNEKEHLYKDYALSIEKSLGIKKGQHVRVHFHVSWGCGRMDNKSFDGYYDGVVVDKEFGWKFVPKMYKAKKDGSMSKISYSLYVLPSIEEIFKFEVIK